MHFSYLSGSCSPVQKKLKSKSPGEPISFLTGGKSLNYKTVAMGVILRHIVTQLSFLTDQQKGKRKKASPAEKNELQRVTTEHDEMVITEILSCSSTSLPPDTFTDEKQQESEPVADCVSFTETAGKKTVPHPHFGGKQPKPHKPPKCISVTCKEEKENLAEELQNTRKELNKALDELSKCIV